MEYDKCMSGTVKISLTMVFRRAARPEQEGAPDPAAVALPAPGGPPPHRPDWEGGLGWDRCYIGCVSRRPEAEDLLGAEI